MSQLKPISFRELVSKLEEFDFEGPYPGGKHLFMIKGNERITLPNPHKKEISTDLLIRILRQAGVKREDWAK